MLRSGAAVNVADLRDMAEFERAHVEGAVRLDPLSLRTLDAWKAETLVLVGSGAAYRALRTLRARLTEEGFKEVRILEGGVRHWRQLQGQIHLGELLVKPDRLDLAGDSERWVVVATEDLGDAMGELEQLILPAGEEVRQATRRVQNHLQRARQRADQVANVLLISGPGQDREVLAMALARSLRDNVFVLDGSASDLQSSMALRKRLGTSSSLDVFARQGGQCW
ncbi:rhodanese-like domain-containing protein [Pseudoxanthomonas sp. CAU 1598]|uniref:Rhodanese-like domain-containing protein n=2 Tax=Pseudomarimonas arenosa TaxID=2774145 RepID=A0AAW3ZVV4_9GAMM|nr:rhodanese-like domain-containing protein [Pseudomarimonas arenosa]